MIPIDIPALIDACQVCDPPFDRPGCPALTVSPSEGRGTVTSHECGWCGSSWRLWSDMYGFPVLRILDPVSPADAEIHRGMIAEALAEQDRERKSTSPPSRPERRAAA
jgi:hypothetical protein